MPDGFSRLRSHAQYLSMLWLLAPWSVARADVIPPDGTPRATCTLDKNCSPGQECVWCSAGYWDRDVCMRNLPRLQLEQQCSSGGSSSWTELWCRPASGAMDASIRIPPLDGGQSPNNIEQVQNLVMCKATADSGGDGGCAVAATSSNNLIAYLSGLSLWLLMRARRRVAHA